LKFCRPLGGSQAGPGRCQAGGFPRPPRRFFLKKALKTELNGVRRMTQKFNSIHSGGGAGNGDFCRAEGERLKLAILPFYKPIHAYTRLYTPIHAYTRLRRKK
jgi:hypothetical protein